MTDDKRKIDRGVAAEHQTLLRSLQYSMHELPAGVLWNPNAATPKQCAILLGDLKRFEDLSAIVSLDQKAFIEGCRWHLEHYPHYLSRKKHFSGYAQYIEERKGPLRVTA